MNEKSKLVIISACINKQLTELDASKRLKLSVRQVQRLKQKVILNLSLLHGNCGKTSSLAFSDAFRSSIISLYKTKYSDSNFSHFTELLFSNENVDISYSAVRNILKSAALKSPKRHKHKHKKSMRERKPCFGEMLQGDATPFEWFGCNEKYALHGFIDDATGIVTGLYLTKNECLNGYFKALERTLTAFGVPESLYVDGSSVFFPKQNRELTTEELLDGIEEHHTQFGEVADYLGIKLIHAHSSQAKGRIERLWNTLQSRLLVEFRLNNITTLEAANEYLVSYVKKYSEKFSVRPASEKNLFVPLHSSINLNELLTAKISRTLDNCRCFSFHNTIFQLDRGLPREKITILIGENSLKIKTSKGFAKIQYIRKGSSCKYSHELDAVINSLVFLYMHKNEHSV